MFSELQYSFIVPDHTKTFINRITDVPSLGGVRHVIMYGVGHRGDIYLGSTRVFSIPVLKCLELYRMFSYYRSDLYLAYTLNE